MLKHVEITCVITVVSAMIGVMHVEHIWAQQTLPKNCEVKGERLKFVTVHVKGYTHDQEHQDGERDVVESTYERGIPMEFQLGIGMVFVGLDKGIEGMCIGEKRKLVIPPNEAYKKRGKQKPKLPPNKTLIYEVELLNVSDFATMNAFNWLDLNADGKLSKSEALEMIEMTFEPNPQFPSMDSDKMLNMYMNMHDTNKDQYISAEEYRHSSERAHKTKMDLEGQGAFRASNKHEKVAKPKTPTSFNKDEL